MKRGLLLAVFVIMVLLLVPGVALAEYTDNLIPEMTSNTTPSGIASSSSHYQNEQTWDSYKAFDRLSSTEWASNEYVTNPPHWIGYEFSSGKIIKKYTLLTKLEYTRSPKAWIFQGSNDGTNWTDLDSRTESDANVFNTTTPREYTFNNNNTYTKYRLYITEVFQTGYVVAVEMEMMEEVVSIPSAPSDLNATAGDQQVSLSWTAVTGATSYKVKRATTQGGPYTEIATDVTTTSYNDTSVTNGITYYYVVTAVNTGGESGNSNEASATPQASTGNAVLIITMVDGDDKQYNTTMTVVNDFISWYNGRAGGSGNPYYVFDKGAISPYSSCKDYLIFDKIAYFEVNES